MVTRNLLRRKAVAVTDEDHPGGRRRNPRRAAAIDDAIVSAELTDHIGRAFIAVWLLAAIAGCVATGLAFAGIGPIQLAPSGTGAADVLSILTNVGTYLTSFLILLLVVLGIQTYRNLRVRRSVGLLWDAATFWPRACHPLAPPCYAERAVPELVRRGSWLATEQEGLILAGHSQGSVLAAAVVLQMPETAASRTALVTTGSPLGRLYARLFPSYVGQKMLAEVKARLTRPGGEPRWINLWRSTDPIGGPIGLQEIDQRLRDPAWFDSYPGDTSVAAIRGHGGYLLEPSYTAAVTDLRRSLAPAPTGDRTE